MPGSRCAGWLFPSAERPGGHVAAAADRAGVAVGRRNGLGARRSHRSVGCPEAPGCRHQTPPVSVLVITGTDTGVGKTVATAALACHARLAGIDVAVCKPVQTGSPRDDDLADVARLSGVSALHGRWRYPEPLAPAAAAGRAGMALPTRDELVTSVTSVDAKLTLVEGAGGLLVELGQGGATLRDLARDLGAPVLVVVSP